MTDYVNVRRVTLVTPIDQTQLIRLRNGGVAGRNFSLMDAYAIRIEHLKISSDERDDVLDFFAANLALPVDVDYMGVTYTCKLVIEPTVIELDGAVYNVTVDLVGNVA
jgi:hypothetical protein